MRCRSLRTEALISQLSVYDVRKCDEGLELLRLVRDPDEVNMLRIAAKISDRMLHTAMECAVRPGMSGAALMAAVEHTGRRSGAEFSSCWLAIGAAPVTTYFELMELSPSIRAGDRVQLGTTMTYEGYFGQGLRMGILGPVPGELYEVEAAIRETQDAALAS